MVAIKQVCEEWKCSNFGGWSLDGTPEWTIMISIAGEEVSASSSVLLYYQVDLIFWRFSFFIRKKLRTFWKEFRFFLNGKCQVRQIIFAKYVYVKLQAKTDRKKILWWRILYYHDQYQADTMMNRWWWFTSRIVSGHNRRQSWISIPDRSERGKGLKFLSKNYEWWK